MQLTLDEKSSPLLIRALGDGQIRIADQTYTSSVLITSDTVHEDWPVSRVTDLEDAHWAPILEAAPSIVLFGTGNTLDFPTPAQTAALTTRQIGVEIMDTAAACRTFNVLLTEGRSVAAAIIL